MEPKYYWSVLKETAQEFGKDKAPRLAAALAYYTLFSLAPILVIAVAIAGLVFGDEAARGQIGAQLQHLLGAKGAAGVQEMIANSSREKAGVMATIIGTLTLLLGASGVFGQLKDALNTIWSVPPKKGAGIKGLVKDRFLSLTMVLGVGFLLLVSLLFSAGIAALGKHLLSGIGETVVQLGTLVLDFAVATVLFALLFRYLPDKRVPWRNVWLGAAVTSALFAAGKILIGIYLGKSAIASTFGAAGSLAIILVWLYYSGLIFFFGAEFTEVYARRRGEHAAGNVGSKKSRDETASEAKGPLLLPPASAPPQVAPVAARKSSKAAIAGAGIGGMVVGALGTSIAAVVIAVKGTKKLLKF
jgi:membrane protein